nr:hypothetical protein [Sphingomonas psychrolutea]
MEREDLFSQIRSAAHRLLRGQKDEATNGEWRRLKIAAPGKIMDDVINAAGLEARQRHMRHELARVRRQTDALANALDLSLKSEHLRGGRDTGPDGMGLLRTEGSDTIQLECKFRSVNAVEAVDDFVGGPSIDISDETQGDVVILHIDPSGTRQAAAQKGEAQRRATRNLEGSEYSRHRELPESFADAHSESRNP